jgi:RNA recognition motif-containing protein
MFKEFGEIESAVVKKDANGLTIDSGFVCFKDPLDAEKALEAMNKKA